MALPTDVDGTWLNPNSVSLDAGELRRADAAMFAGDGSTFGVRGGIVRHSDTAGAVTIDGSDVVTIKACSVVIPGNAVAGTGPYRFGLSSDITGAIAARHATLSRIDLVVARQLDTDVVAGHGAYKSRFQIITGNPGSGAPALPSMAVELARISVPANGGGAASVDSTFRTFATALGGELVVPTEARLPATAPQWQRGRALDTGVAYTFDGTSWVRAATRSITIKTADESVTSSTTLQNDDHLSLPVVAGQSYIFEALLVTFNADSSVDLKVGFSFPSGAMTFGALALDPASPSGQTGSVSTVAVTGATSGSSALSLGAGAGTGTVMLSGSFVATSTGTVRLMWAQKNSSANPQILKAGSWLRAETVS